MCPASHTPLNSRWYLKFVCALKEMTEAAILVGADKIEFYVFHNTSGGKGLYWSWFGSFLINNSAFLSNTSNMFDGQLQPVMEKDR